MTESSQPSREPSPIKQAYLALEAMQSRLDALERRQREPIAVVGLGCRFPGGAVSPQAYWDRILDQFDAVGEIPAERQKLFDMDRLPPEARAGAYLDHPVDEFDPQFFGISPREAHSMDPQQRLLLEVVWEALEDAAIDPKGLAGTRAGVFIGVTSGDYNHLFLQSQDTDLLDGYYTSGIAHSVLSGRISYILGLTGPSLTVDTACSSSLVALHLAMGSLRRGDCDLALVGGVNLMLSSENHISLSRFGMLSPDGRCKAFDASANGFGRGEGCGVVALRRLSDAQAQRERVQAVVLGSGISQDGASGGLTVPNGPAQSEAIRQALQDAGVGPEMVSYVETHGTGTSLGDPIEANALGAVYGGQRPQGRPLLLGSVKANMGHLEAAAGVAGLIKLVLSLQHQVLPAHRLFSGKSGLIAWEKLGLDIPEHTGDWVPVDGRRIAGLSSFGFSGTNVHVVVSAAPEETPAQSAAPDRPVHLLTLSAQDEPALQAAAGNLLGHLLSHPEERLPDIAYSAGAGRAHFGRRLAVVARDRGEALEALSGFQEGIYSDGLYRTPTSQDGTDRPKIAFLFSGQGSQYTGMGRQLYASSPAFRSALERCAAILDEALDIPLLDLLFEEACASQLNHTAYTQPALFALEWSLSELWRSWGILPAAVMGHSVGEYTAACLAGVFSVEDGLRLMAARGKLFGALPENGGMAAVLAPEERLAPVVARYSGVLSIAGLNAPNNTVISGERRALAAALAELNAAGIETRPLNVSHAFHSPLLDPALDSMEKIASSVPMRPPKYRLVSNLTGGLAGPDTVTQPVYWREHARQPVRFAAGMETLNQLGMQLWVEIGPGKTLAGLARRCLPAEVGRGNIFTSIEAGAGEWEGMLGALAGMYVRGAAVDWEGFDRDYPRRRTSLPTYPFQRSRYWISPKRRSPRAQPAAKEGPGRDGQHPLLGSRVISPLATVQFEAALRLGELDFFDDHRVAGRSLLPGAAIIETLLAAARSRLNSPQITLRNVVLITPLVLEGEQECRLQSVAEQPDAQGAVHVQLYSWRPESQNWMLHAEAWAYASEPVPGDEAGPGLETLRGRCPRSISAEEHQSSLQEAGLDFGPSLLGVRAVYQGVDEALARIQLPAGCRAGAFGVHPALLDAALQVSRWVLPGGGPALLPFSLDSVSVLRPGVQAAWSWAQAQRKGSDFTVDIRLLDDTGEPVIEARGIRFRPWEGAKGSVSTEGLYQVGWEALESAREVEGQKPASLTRELAPVYQELEQRENLNAYLRTMPRLERLSTAYIYQALHELGWQPAPGEKITLDDLRRRLGVLPRYGQLLGRILEILTEEAVLQPCDDGWQVMAPIPAVDPGRLAEEAAALVDPGCAVHTEAAFVLRCGTALADVLRGQADPLALLFPGGDLTAAQSLYGDTPSARVYNQVLCRAVESTLSGRSERGLLRVLEVGAGTGGTTAHLLPLLSGKCDEYRFTDLSPLFLARAQEKFAAYPFLRTAIFDLDQDPEAQGLNAGAYDLIVASNVVHATRDLRRSVERLRSLLAPGGWLILLEVTQAQRWIDVTFGLTEGWWRFADCDLRPDYPLLTAARWEELLQSAGFEPAALPDPGQGEAANTLLLARRPEVPLLEPGTWLILAEEEDELGVRLSEALRSAGSQAVMAGPGNRFERCVDDRFLLRPGERADFDRLISAVVREGPSPLAGAVYLWGRQAALAPEAPGAEVARLEARICGGLLHLAQALIAAPAGVPPRLLAATSLASRVEGEAGPFSPAAASLWGLMLTLAREHPELDASVVDLGAGDASALARQLLQEMAAPAGETLLAVRGGERLAARLQEIPGEALGLPSPHRRLEIAERGSLQNLRLTPFEPALPGAGEVSIQVRAAGLNFKDVLKALGMVQGDETPLGSECSGIVIATGPGVTGWQVGDEVIALTPGAFASVVNARSELVVWKPASLGWEAAATFPVAFVTAAYALQTVAQVKAGERVLIHSAAGGVGLAAVQIAMRAGAEVFATAGSEEKHRYLHSLGIQHVFSSRSPDFAAQIMEITGGQGIQVILNSLAGDMIPASLSVLAEGGRFIELGKTALLTEPEIARLPGERRYIPVDWTEVARDEPGMIRSLLLELLGDLPAGRLRPLPVRGFNLEEAEQAFRFMSAARHTGKLALVFAPLADEPAVRKDGSYLISGGLGGLGLHLANWLVEAGAGCVVLVSRRPAGTKEAQVLLEMGQRGTKVLVEVCDVAEEEPLQALFSGFGRELPPLHGILHLAGVLDKSTLVNMTWEQMAAVMRPKILGAWNLHRLSAEHSLDFFVLFSSAASVFGAPGQANHAAANAFLDALAHERRSQGLPGVSINWGAWAQMGAAAESAAEVDSQGLRWISPDQGLTWLKSMLRAASPQWIASPMDWARFLEHFPNRQALPFFREAAARQMAQEKVQEPLSRPGRDEPRSGLDLPFDQLAGMPGKARSKLLAEIVSSQVRDVLGIDPDRPVGERKPLSELGLDSLMAVELRNRISQRLQLERPLPATLVFDYPTIEAITGYVDGLILNSLASTPGEAAASPEQQRETDLAAVPELEENMDALLNDLENLSDEDVDRLLNSQRTGELS